MVESTDIPSIYGVKLIRGGRVAVHRSRHKSSIGVYPPGMIVIVYGVNPKGPGEELDGVFVDGQIVAQGWRPLKIVGSKYVEVPPDWDHENSLIDKFHVGLLRRIAIEGDGESRVWAIETLLEMKV